MHTLAGLVDFVLVVLELLIWVIVAQAILSWLVAFNVVDLRNRFVATVVDTLDRVTGPLLGPIRRRLPDLGGIDVSPVVLILGIILVQRLLSGLTQDLLLS
ncbi:MAG: YggT family protein [Sphingomonadaceae bacterium]|uniref:YggT family protein n=1 Tax=Thermaurantiacus sp. TaxID=2820283 RepID=UPI00298EFF51|nr:YggT family protein [Thermaurantiacus sp.]MCS6987180.1 YggT family protein [Sphingomonadaceae bacterium]MDW8415786.1 YggT family protein [Thermaurantiacus sp.]